MSSKEQSLKIECLILDLTKNMQDLNIAIKNLLKKEEKGLLGSKNNILISTPLQLTKFLSKTQIDKKYLTTLLVDDLDYIIVRIC